VPPSPREITRLPQCARPAPSPHLVRHCVQEFRVLQQGIQGVCQGLGAVIVLGCARHDKRAGWGQPVMRGRRAPNPPTKPLTTQ
jgi:hypothetical protein